MRVSSDSTAAAERAAAGAAGTGVGTWGPGTGVGAGVTGTGVGAAWAGTGVGAGMTGTRVGAAWAGTGVAAGVADSLDAPALRSSAPSRTLRSSIAAPCSFIRHQASTAITRANSSKASMIMSRSARRFSGGLDRHLTNRPQVHLPGSERRNRVDDAQILALGQPQSRQLRAAQPLP